MNNQTPPICKPLNIKGIDESCKNLKPTEDNFKDPYKNFENLKKELFE